MPARQQSEGLADSLGAGRAAGGGRGGGVRDENESDIGYVFICSAY